MDGVYSGGGVVLQIEVWGRRAAAHTLAVHTAFGAVQLEDLGFAGALLRKTATALKPGSAGWWRDAAARPTAAEAAAGRGQHSIVVAGVGRQLALEGRSGKSGERRGVLKEGHWRAARRCGSAFEPECGLPPHPYIFEDHTFFIVSSN